MQPRGSYYIRLQHVTPFLNMVFKHVEGLRLLNLCLVKATDIFIYILTTKITASEDLFNKNNKRCGLNPVYTFARSPPGTAVGGW